MRWQIEFYRDKSGFLKKTDKTPEREIELAEKRMNDFIERYGGKI